MRIPRRKGAWASASRRLQIAALVVLAALLVVSLLKDSADLQAVARRLQEKLRTDQQPLQAREIIIKNTVSVNAYIHTNHHHQQKQQQPQQQQAASDAREAPSSTHALVENVTVDVTDLEEEQRVKDDQHEEEEEDVDVVNLNFPAAAGQSRSESEESLVDALNTNDAIGDRRPDVGEEKLQQRQVMEMRPSLSLPAERMDHREEQQQQQQEEGGDCEEEEESISSAGEGEGEGEWVYDEALRPLYREEECGFLTEQVTCIRNGRRDDTYQKWRWQPRPTSPSRCNSNSSSSHLHLLSRFDGKALLERLRNKRMMFVGDSLNRNQWESMVCLLQSEAPRWDSKSLVKNGSLNVFRFHDYNATVEFYWAPFLVESNSDDPDIHTVSERVIRPTSIAKHAANWRGVHFLIFNTYIWWMNTDQIKVLRRGSRSPPPVSNKYDEMDRVVAYKKVLKTWARWVQANVDPDKTMVFFMSVSPVHMQSEGWGNPGAIKCSSETLPATNYTGKLELGTDWRLFWTARKVARRVRVRFVDITAMSEIRKDAHTSVHTLRQGKLLTPEQQAQPAKYADCIHWCLPGVPDTWNHFIYAHILRRHPNPISAH